MIRKIFFFCLIIFAFDASSQSKMATINPIEPMKYEHENGYFKILSYIKQENLGASKLKCEIDGRKVALMPTSNKDSLLVWLPMIGNSCNLKISSGKNIKVEQVFRPIIPADWGYFNDGTIHLIQSSHQDIGWIDTPDYCRKDRINNIVLPALELMEKNKDFKFEMEQTLYLMEFLEQHPEKKDQVIKLYKEKRFSWGATYNQPYEGVLSGEQLVRQAYYGRKWILDNMPGCDDLVANNIDVPGRTWQMPQILAKSGIPNLFISRMGEGMYDWQSPDGSTVLTFSPGNYGWASLMWKFFDKNGVSAFQKLHHRSQLWSDYFKEHNIPPHYAVLMSCDATKPVDYQIIIDEWNNISSLSAIPLPRIVCSTSEKYFQEIRGANTNFEKIQGDRPNLWLYIHGPAHYEAIKCKREAAVLLPAAESFSTFSALINKDWSLYPQKRLDRAWIASIYPDHGWGGKNGEKTDAIFSDSLKVSRDLGRSMLNESLSKIVENVNVETKNWIVFNDLTWSRDQQVKVLISQENAIVKDDVGNVIPSQITVENGKYYVAFIAKEIPAMGYKSFKIEGKKSKKKDLKDIIVSANMIENCYYKAILGNGGIVSLYDKELGKELIHTAKFACGDVIELGYGGNGAGEFTRITDVWAGDITSLTQFETQWEKKESGAIYTCFEATQKTKHGIIVQKITFFHLMKQIDFDITLQDFDGAHNRQYRVAFPLNMMRERTINYEVPMGVAQVGKDELSIQPKGWAWDGTYVHHPADSHPREIQNFISANGNGFGVTLASGVAVADWIDPSREQAVYPILQGILLSTHKSCHGEGNWYHQEGTHHYKFSLSSHVEGWKNGYAFALGYNHPLQAVKKENEGGSLIQLIAFCLYLIL